MDPKYMAVLRDALELGHLNEPPKKPWWSIFIVAPPDPENFKVCGFDTPLSNQLRLEQQREQEQPRDWQEE